MTTEHQQRAARAAGTALAMAASASTTVAASELDDLLTKIRSEDDAVRGPAWQSACACGSSAIRPLVVVMGESAAEPARAAKRAVWSIVRHAGRPGAREESLAVERELIQALAATPPGVRRELLWMLSEIGSDAAVTPMAALLDDADVREDARCALTRMPGAKPTAALKKAFAKAPEDFRYALAESLRARGERVRDYPSRKMVPERKTSVLELKTGAPAVPK